MVGYIGVYVVGGVVCVVVFSHLSAAEVCWGGFEAGKSFCDNLSRLPWVGGWGGGGVAKHLSSRLGVSLVSGGLNSVNFEVRKV